MGLMCLLFITFRWLTSKKKKAQDGRKDRREEQAQFKHLNHRIQTHILTGKIQAMFTIYQQI